MLLFTTGLLLLPGQASLGSGESLRDIGRSIRNVEGA